MQANSNSMSFPIFLSRIILVLIIAFLSPLTGLSQDCACAEYDRLKNEQKKKDDDVGIYAAQLKKSPNIICQAKAYEWMAIDYLDQQKADSSELFFQQAEKLYRRSGCNDSVYLETYKYWAQLYYTKGDFAKTQEYAFKLLQSAETSGSAYETAVCHTMIAQLFNQTNQAEKGITYTHKAVQLIGKIKNRANLADVFSKLSKRYLWHFQDTKTASSLDSSELFSLQQLAIARELNNTRSISFAFANLEGIAWERGDLKKALVLLDSSFKYINPENYDNLGTNFYDKSDILIELKQYEEAKKMADSSLYYRKRDSNPAYIAEVYELLLSKISKLTGDYKMAYEYKEMARAITDSVRNIEKTKQVAELEKKYNQAKNERKIEKLAQQKRMYLLLVLAALLGIAALAFYLRQQSLKNKQKILETEQRLNRARMNPHFFFNALSTLQSFALKENDGKALASNLSKFSHIMRETLESTYKEYVTVEQEMDFLHEYLELQKIRFPQKFNYSVEADAALEVNEVMIPAMILQPFAENSIEHGFSGIDYPGFIAIKFRPEKDSLLISITDNGKGLLKTANDQNGHVSRASQIIKDRIYLLNIKLKTKASFSIDNNPDGNGVIVKVNLPLIFSDQVKDKKLDNP